MRNMKGKKKFLVAFAALSVAAVTLATTLMHDATEVVATQKVFDGMKSKYSTTSQVNILEIVPATKTPVTHTITTGGTFNFSIYYEAELGYFMPAHIPASFATYKADNSNYAPNNASWVSRGGVHGKPFASSTTSQEYKDALYNYYQYGLIKPEGSDNGWNKGLGEYPIYAKTAIFAKFQNQICNNRLGDRLVNGYYEYVGTGGDYNIDTTKYFFDPSNHYQIGTLSDNAIGDDGHVKDIDKLNSLSFNSLIEDSDIDLSQLPYSYTKGELITQPTAGSGNLKFISREGEDQESVPYHFYKGYSSDVLYYSNSDQTMMRNSDWWNEYVMGDLRTFEDAKVETPYVIKAANEVTVSDINKADLIYISGTHQAFATANSYISDDVLIKIYNDEVNYKHKAVMMDYLCYDNSATALKDKDNISKLAALLWQTSQQGFYTNNKTKHAGWFATGTDTYTPKGTTTAKQFEYHNLKKSALADADLWAATQAKGVPVAPGTGNGNFVTGNTYVYNHHVADFSKPKSKVDAFDNIANGDFNSAYKNTDGMSAVQRYIESTNLNSISGQMSTKITPAVCIQYILCSEGVDLDILKTSLKVLEIEPVPSFLYNTQRGSQEFAELSSTDDDDKKVIKNRQDFVKKYLTNFYSEDERISFIEFESMTVYEFNSRNEDLVENYDIIYIGDETTKKDGNSYYYDNWWEKKTHEWNESKNKYEDKSTTKISQFRDTRMSGNIYYNVGDKVQLFGMHPYYNNGGVSGWFDNQTFMTYNGPDTEADKDKVTAPVVEARYSPRDITKNKLAKLEEFVDSNALVLVAENLMGTPEGDTKNTVINPTIIEGNENSEDIYGRVDSSSNLYEFLNYAFGKAYLMGSDGKGVYRAPTAAEKQAYDKLARYKTRDNIVAVSDIKRGFVSRDSLADYVSTQKLSLVLTGAPDAYRPLVENNGVITDEVKLSDKFYTEEGFPFLEYTFSIDGDADTTGKDGYSVGLYIDINKDGKFSKTTEIVDDVVITTSDGSQEALKNDTTGAYILYPNIEYKLYRELADDFNGLINWKLDVQSNAVGLEHIHASEKGYTLVASKEKQKIRILQITNNINGGYSSTLDLESALYETRVNGSDNSWGLLLNEVPDYELYIRTVTVSEYQNMLKSKYDSSGSGYPTFNDYAKDAAKDGGFFDNFVVMNVSERICNETPYASYKTPGPSTTPGDTLVVGSKLREYFYPGVDFAALTVEEREAKDEVGVDMIVCGFGDDYVAFSQPEALTALQSFIQMGKPVLTSHDFVHFRVGISQNRVLRNSYGADLFGVSQDIFTSVDVKNNTRYSLVNAWNPVSVTNDTDLKKQRTNIGLNYLHSGVAYSRKTNADQFKAIEGTGKEVAYQPNSLKNTTVPETQGLSSINIEWNRNWPQSGFTWINCTNASAGKDKWYGSSQSDLWPDKEYTIEQVNEGQITNYPYKLKKSFKTTATHSQYYTLDLTSDLDDDGESDVVVWYALGDSNANNPGGYGVNPYSETTGGSIDPANGYYIYNDGNITYTGAGHRDLRSAGLDEVELFVNTLIAAAQPSLVPSQGTFYDLLDVKAKPISSIIVPYDGNVTQVKDAKGNITSDSSILQKEKEEGFRYKFVDPNTETVEEESDKTLVYYRINDKNVIRGEKEIHVKYYIQIPGVYAVQPSAAQMQSGMNKAQLAGSIQKLQPDNVSIELEGNGPYKVKYYYSLDANTKIPMEYIGVNKSKTNSDDKANIWVLDVSGRINTYETTQVSITTPAMTRDTKAKNDAEKDGSVDDIVAGDAYGVYLPMNFLKENARFVLWVESQTIIKSVSTSGYIKETPTPKSYSSLTVTKADLLDLD